MRDRHRVAVAGLLAAVLATIAPPTADAARATPRSAANARIQGLVIARTAIKAARGGYVLASAGAWIFVPPNVMRRNGFVTIRRSAHREYDFSISAPWRGHVAISVPLHTKRDSIVHQVGHTWVLEGERRGQTIVWVTQLSWFSTLADKSKAVLCLTWNKHKFLECALSKGLSKLDSKLAHWVASKISDRCAAAMLAGFPTASSIPVTWFSDPACVKTVGDPPAPTAPIFDPAAYNGHIVKANDGSSTSWLVVDAHGHRNWIPDQATFNCLKTAGHPGPDLLLVGQIELLPDQPGVTASCSSSPTHTTPTQTTPTQTTPTQTTPTPTGPSITISDNGGQMAVQLHGFPTGTAYFYCHSGDGSTFPTGGTITDHASMTISSPEQSWSSGWCSGTGNFWLGIQATDGHDYYSNQTTLTPAPATFNFTITGTCRAGCGLWLFSGPDYHMSSSDGTVLQIVCQARGATLSEAGYTSAIWDKTLQGDWASDLYLNTPVYGDFSPGIPRC
jgi:hypothetical protein